MVQRGPECQTDCHEALGRCGACGALLLGAKRPRRWEQQIVPYVVMALLGGLIAAVLWYLFYGRPCASSGESRPLSAASAASFRIADILIMMDDDPSPRSSSDTRHALTVALVNPGRGACWNQAINSLRAML